VANIGLSVGGGDDTGEPDVPVSAPSPSADGAITGLLNVWFLSRAGLDAAVEVLAQLLKQLESRPRNATCLPIDGLMRHAELSGQVHVRDSSGFKLLVQRFANQLVLVMLGA
jgi:hypothetical protein